MARQAAKKAPAKAPAKAAPPSQPLTTPGTRRAAGLRHACHEGDEHCRRYQSGWHRQVRYQDRYRLPRPYAGAAFAPQSDRYHAARRRRPAYRLPSHHRRRGHRAGRVPDQGAGRPRWHPPLRRGADPDGRDPDRGGTRRVEPAVPNLEGEFLQAQARYHGHRAVQGVVPGLRPARRADLARGNHYGDNNHHIVESCFKGIARALRVAIELDPRQLTSVPSTKGVL